MAKSTNKKTKNIPARTSGNVLRTHLGRSHASSNELPDAMKLNTRQQRTLVITVIIALLAGVILIRGFFGVIMLSLLASIIFYPLYKLFLKKLKRRGTASMLTFLVALLLVIIPVVIALILTINEVNKLISQASQFSAGSLTISQASDKILQEINNFLAAITKGAVQVSAGQFAAAVAKIVGGLANGVLNFLTSSFSSIPAFVTEFILFLYLFTSMLKNSERLLGLVKDLNPLGDEVSSLYISRTGEMARGIVGGQFVIAFIQGVVSAAVLYIAGIHYFFFFSVLLTFMSVIPLGAGILTIPIGIILMLTGNIWQGLLVILNHFIVISNIDNILRPKLVSKEVRMNSALMMLSVFGGIELFGFLGIAIGPIVMILVLSTLQVYLPLARAYKASKKDAATLGGKAT